MILATEGQVIVQGITPVVLGEFVAVIRAMRELKVGDADVDKLISLCGEMAYRDEDEVDLLEFMQGGMI